MSDEPRDLFGRKVSLDKPVKVGRTIVLDPSYLETPPEETVSGDEVAAKVSEKAGKSRTLVLKPEDAAPAETPEPAPPSPPVKAKAKASAKTRKSGAPPEPDKSVVPKAAESVAVKPKAGKAQTEKGKTEKASVEKPEAERPNAQKPNAEKLQAQRLEAERQKAEKARGVSGKAKGRAATASKQLSVEPVKPVEAAELAAPAESQQPTPAKKAKAKAPALEDAEKFELKSIPTPASSGGGDVPGGGDGSGGGGWRDDGHLKRLMDENFLSYASYVIRDRAIPDLDDGLKPVQRRILHSLKENDDGKFIKVANIVGHSMQYHPHGDASIADALVTLTNKRYLIEGQGNFGNLLTGDPAAASRYIECRLTELARTQIFNDELTKFVPSYDGRRKEPVCLPAKLPLLLMLGAEGIAVGLSTKVLPHNFVELLEAQIAILQKKPFTVYPDFQHGGLMDVSEYDKGLGRVRVRAEIETRDENTLVIKSVPFGTTTDSVIASIEAAAKKKGIKIKSINDFTAEQVEIEVVMKPDSNLKKTMQSLYAFTQCQVAMSSRIVVIHKNRPVELDVEQVLRHNTKMLVRTLKRELEAERRRLLEAFHNLTLVQIFIENRIYKDIEECKTYPDVQKAVLDGVNKFRSMLKRDVTGKDVETLLAVKIKRISRYDMNKNRKDIDDILEGLDKVDKNLGELTAYAVRFLRGLIRKYGDDYPRLTQIEGFKSIDVHNLTANELTLYHDVEKGYVGHSISGEELFQCSSLDKLLVVKKDGHYKLVNPPDKLFVDTDMPYCAVMDRDKVFVLVYREDNLTYMKRFTFGGAILNKDYSCVPKDAELLFFSADNPKMLYVKYTKKKGQRIHQQSFDLTRLAVRTVKTRGVQMTSKTVAAFYDSKPKGWSDKKSGPPGVFLKF